MRSKHLYLYIVCQILLAALLLTGCGASSSPAPTFGGEAKPPRNPAATQQRQLPTQPPPPPPRQEPTQQAAPPPTLAPREDEQPQQHPTAPILEEQAPPLRAGEIDDNTDFGAYLSYLRGYPGPPASFVDVEERMIFTVVNDDQEPLLNARVELYDGERLVFNGLTYAGGRTIFHPRSVGLSQGSQLQVSVSKDGESILQRLERNGESTQTFRLVLPQAEPLPDPLRLDVLFLLDATGSMGDEIGQLQASMVSIAERIARVDPSVSVRFGLVAYRDRGDEYVTRAYDFTGDVASFRAALLEVEAGGGGDNPESLNEALHVAVQDMPWDSEAMRMIFLVADAPPHLDYGDYDYVEEIRHSVARGIKIFPIAASNTNEQGEYVFRQLAQQTLAGFLFLTYESGENAGVPGDTTVHNVDASQFTVDRLDDLVVQVVERELARLR